MAMPTKAMDATSYYLGLPAQTQTSRDLQALNARSSRLLRLPSELRRKIYGLVLGGHSIHFGYQSYSKPYSPTLYICRQDQSERDFAQDVSTNHTDNSRIAIDISGHHERHTACKSKDDLKVYHLANVIPLGLLSVCRQIHNEAALVPFEENEFIIAEFIHIPALQSILNERQGQAIRNITIPGTDTSVASIRDDLWVTVICWFNFLHLNHFTLICEVAAYSNESPELKKMGTGFIQRISLLQINARRVDIVAYAVKCFDRRPFLMPCHIHSIEQLSSQLISRSTPSEASNASADPVPTMSIMLRNPRKQKRKG